MNTYALLLALSGLSNGEAAAFHRVALQSVKNWTKGRDDTPPGILAEIRGLIDQQERMARAMLSIHHDQAVEQAIETTWDPSEWPCRSAAAMALARVASKVSVPVRLID